MLVNLCLIAGGLLAGETAAWERFEATQIHMGTSFKIVLYAGDQTTANLAFSAAFDRVRQLNAIMSDYDSSSELSRLCQSSPTDEPVPVSADLALVLAKSQDLARESQGAFDVTVGPLTRLWRRARRQGQLPDADRLAVARRSVGFHHLHIDRKARTAQLLKPDMRIDLGGIAKGYAADEALAAIRRRGIRRAIVDAGGDMSIGDPPPETTGWKIGISVLQRGAAPDQFLSLANCGIATSGDAWQFIEIGGTRYSHILDPKTGMGLTERIGVTVLARDCTTADSLASAISVLGPKRGVSLAEKRKVSTRILRAAGDGAEEIVSGTFADRIRKLGEPVR